MSNIGRNGGVSDILLGGVSFLRKTEKTPVFRDFQKTTFRAHASYTHHVALTRISLAAFERCHKSINHTPGSEKIRTMGSLIFR